MAMNALRKSASGGLGKFILFGFLVLAVGGLVLTDVGGFFRGGVSGTDAAIVGSEKISIRSFDSNLRRTLSRIGLSPQEAYKAGYVNQLLGTEIRTRLLSLVAKERGVHVDKEHVAKEIKTIIDPYVKDGQDPKAVFSQILMSQGMSEQAFVETVGRDIENNLLNAGLNNGFADISNLIAEDTYRHNQEKRSIEYVVFKNDEIKDIPTATNEQLLELYEGTKESFAQPETRRFKLITVKTDKLKDTIDLSEEELRAAYDDNIELYTTEANRTLETALLNNEADAKAVVEALNTGKKLKEAVKAVTSQTSGYLGEQSLTEDSLIEEIKDDILAAEKSGTIIGPAESPIGWYVAILKKFNPTVIKSYSEVKKDIKNEILENLVIDQQYELANNVDDMLAGGASLEEVAEQIDLNIQTLPTANRYGADKNGKDALAKHADVKTTVLDTGFQLEEGETSPIFETNSGQFMAIYLDELTPKTYTPYEELKDKLSARWLQDQVRVGNRLKTMKYLTNLNANGLSLSELSKSHKKKLNKRSAIGRNDDPDGVLNQRSVLNLFESQLEQNILIDIDGGVAIAKVTDIKWPNKIDKDDDTFKQFKGELSANMQKEGVTFFLDGKRISYGAKVNQSLLESVYGPESQSY